MRLLASLGVPTPRYAVYGGLPPSWPGKRPPGVLRQEVKNALRLNRPEGVFSILVYLLKIAVIFSTRVSA